MEGETFQHLKAKSDIVRACMRAGYQATTEIVGEGWRADVLASRGETRIAFEVQWSFLRLDECEARQARYQQAGVRGCWFFRTPPFELRARARRDLPLFHLVANADSTFSVELNEHLFGLSDFVLMLLSGRVRFCAEATARHMQEVTACCFDLPCPRCGVRSCVYAIASTRRADCGFRFRDSNSQALLFHRDVRDAYARFKHTATGSVLPLAEVKMREEGQFSQGCVRCDRAFATEDILYEYAQRARHAEEEWIATFTTQIANRDVQRVRAAHWCCPPHGEFCCSS
jgi:hypothetical protein